MYLAVGMSVPSRWIVRRSCTHSSLGSWFAATRPGGSDCGRFGMSLILCLHGSGLSINVCNSLHVVRAGRLDVGDTYQGFPDDVQCLLGLK